MMRYNFFVAFAFFYNFCNIGLKFLTDPGLLSTGPTPSSFLSDKYWYNIHPEKFDPDNSATYSIIYTVLHIL